jgi:hypothetical protein
VSNHSSLGKALGFMFPVRKRDPKGREILPTRVQAEKEAELQQQLLKVSGSTFICSAIYSTKL